MNDAYIVFFISFLITWTAASLNPLPDFGPDRADSNRFESPGNSMNISSPIFIIISQKFPSRQSKSRSQTSSDDSAPSFLLHIR